MRGKSPYPKRQIITTCSVCRLVITIHHAAVWQRQGATGIVHTECATDPDAQPIDTSVVSYRCSEQW